MSDLISRKALCEFCSNSIDRTIDANDIMRFPSAEPERKKGEWKKIGHIGRHYRCDKCGNTLDFDGVNAGRGDANFCPNCGAEMRGNDENAR